MSKAEEFLEANIAYILFGFWSAIGVICAFFPVMKYISSCLLSLGILSFIYFLWRGQRLERNDLHRTFLLMFSIKLMLIPALIAHFTCYPYYLELKPLMTYSILRNPTLTGTRTHHADYVIFNRGTNIGEDFYISNIPTALEKELEMLDEAYEGEEGVRSKNPVRAVCVAPITDGSTDEPRYWATMQGDCCGAKRFSCRWRRGWNGLEGSLVYAQKSQLLQMAKSTRRLGMKVGDDIDFVQPVLNRDMSPYYRRNEALWYLSKHLLLLLFLGMFVSVYLISFVDKMTHKLLLDRFQRSAQAEVDFVPTFFASPVKDDAFSGKFFNWLAKFKSSNEEEPEEGFLRSSYSSYSTMNPNT